MSHPIERRTLGKTGEQVSMIGFGGIVVMSETPADAANYVAEAVDRSVNYFDVAPSYGDAELKLGPAFKPYRDQCFLACKTHEREVEAARKGLENSLRNLQTDHFDLFQLHAISTMDDVEKVFAPGGVMDMLVEARHAGKMKYIGFSAHSEEAAMAAMDRFDFDTILFPFNFATWLKNDFGPAVHKRAQEKNMGILALKSMAYTNWDASLAQENRPWKKAWYQPFDDIDKIRRGLRFTLGLPVHMALPPGHWELFRKALDLAEAGELTPLSPEELEDARNEAMGIQPIFPIAG